MDMVEFRKKVTRRTLIFFWVLVVTTALLVDMGYFMSAVVTAFVALRLNGVMDAEHIIANIQGGKKRDEEKEQ